MKIEDMLLGKPLDGMKTQNVADLARFAWPDDPQRASDFIANFMAQQLDRAERHDA